MIKLLIAPMQWCYRLIRRLGVLDVTRLMHLPTTECHDECCPAGYEIRCVPAEELAQLLRERRISPQVGTPDMSAGGRCELVAAFHDARVVSFAWFASQSVAGAANFSRAAHLGTSVDMPEGTAFVFNAWTDQQHRGKRLIAAIMTWAIRNRVCGACSLLTMIDWTNEKSIRAFAYMGMRPIGNIYRFGRGPLQISLVPGAAAGLGVRVAEDAPGLKWAC
jgi:hypothetical protein